MHFVNKDFEIKSLKCAFGFINQNQQRSYFMKHAQRLTTKTCEDFSKKRHLIAIFSAFAFVAFCASSGLANQVHWGYGKENGPAQWGKLHSDYQSCDTESFKSPIDILDSNAQNSTSTLVFNDKYAHFARDIINNGHTLQVNFDKGSDIVLENEHYALAQLHFHTPSENHLNSKEFPAEVHLVHKDEQGNLLVIGVFIEAGKENLALKSILQSVPKNLNEAKSFSSDLLDLLLPQNRAYYEFIGSLTTPPCSGQVKWIVMQNPIQASITQIKLLHKIFGNNTRGIQPLNERKINLAK